MSRLAAAGADLMFGVPGGGPNIGMIEAGAGAGIRFVLTHGETAACIAAGAYGKLTGSPGVVGVTRGPGVTSSANGMAQATLDRFPLILLSDAVPAAEWGWAAHQRLDQQRMMAPLTKWTGALGSEEPSRVTERAARLAVTAPGRLRPPGLRSHRSRRPASRSPRLPPSSIAEPWGWPGGWLPGRAGRCSWWGPRPFPKPGRCARWSRTWASRPW